MGELLERSYPEDAVTKGWIIAALVKLAAQTGLFPLSIKSHLQRLAQSKAPDLQQRAVEALQLINDGLLMQYVFPTDASCEDLEVGGAAPFIASASFPIEICSA